MENPIIVCDSTNRIISVTKPSLVIFKCRLKDVVGRKFEDVIDFEAPYNKETVKRIIKNIGSIGRIVGIIKNRGSAINIVPSLIYGENYSIKGIVYNLTQVNNDVVRYGFVPALESNEISHEVRHLLLDSDLGVWVWDIKDKVIHLNKAALNILGLPKDKNCISLEELSNLIKTDNMSELRNSINSCLSGAIPTYTGEHRILTPHGNTRWILVKGKVVRRDHRKNPVLFAGTSIDITKLKTALKSKELLEKELHHRVKNNLQLIASMLNLHARRSNDPFVREIIDDSRNRIHAMAIIHEHFYRTMSNGNVNFSMFIAGIVRNLFDMYMVDRKKINVEINTEDITMKNTQTIYCGLILNELVSNSLKHAFPNGGRGKITISLGEHDNEIILKVNDDGKGFAGVNEEKSTFGLILVEMFTRQLNGVLSIENENGTHVTVKFKKEQ